MSRLKDKAALSAAAYVLVDLSDLDDDVRKDIVEDASAGGGTYGIRVVEEVINGAASAPLFGYYKGGADEERWTDAKKELGLSASEADDSTVYAGAGGLALDPRREAALREAAAQRVESEAARIRAGEDADVAAVTGEDGPAPVRAGASGATDNHPTNIVDTTLAPEAIDTADTGGTAAKTKTKTPR